MFIPQIPPARGSENPRPPGPGGAPNLAQPGMPWPGAKKKGGGGKPLQPPGISGTVASLVISPDFFADKNDPKSRRAKKFWSPGKWTSKPFHIQKIDNILLFLSELSGKKDFLEIGITVKVVSTPYIVFATMALCTATFP